jgi:serine phosphatase RsbU (regulator of sigma subunit)
VLLLATDGFFEWEGRSGERFGTERLEGSLRAARSKPAGEIIASLYEDVLKFAGGTRQMDDLTAIVVKRV